MPVYEFYCKSCHMIFSFLSKRPNTEKQPACPKCSKPKLERRVSMFAISKGRKESDDEQMPDIDESRFEQAMMQLAGEADGLDEENPRQMAGLLRKMYAATGLNLGSGMEEAISRMEAGEDPDKIEEDMGDLLEGEDPFSAGSAKAKIKSWKRKYLPPAVDDTLYEL